jgi:hypothetical protein
MPDIRTIWKDDKGKVVAPNTPNAQKVQVRFDDDGNIYQRDWVPDSPTGGFLGLGSTPASTGKWSDEYWVSYDAPKSPTTKEAPGGAEFQWDAQLGTWKPAPGMPVPSTTQPTKQYETDQGIVEVPPSDIASGQAGPRQPGQLVWEDPNAPLKRSLLEAQITAAQRVPAGPLGRQLTGAELELQQLQVDKAKRELANPYLTSIQQQQETIRVIQDQLASGQIDVEEANRLMGLTRSNLDATIRGTTPFQVDQLKQTKKSQQENLARGVLGDQLQTGSNLASGLLTGLGGIYGKILGSSNPPLGFDPMAMGKSYVQDMNGGAELAQLAKALLTGALQPTQGGL